MIAATLAGSWRVSGGFAEGRRSGTRRSEGAEEQVEGLVLFVTTAQVAGSFPPAISREYHVSQRQYTKKLGD
jgi:hypothetical protein